MDVVAAVAVCVEAHAGVRIEAHVVRAPAVHAEAVVHVIVAVSTAAAACTGVAVRVEVRAQESAVRAAVSAREGRAQAGRQVITALRVVSRGPGVAVGLLLTVLRTKVTSTTGTTRRTNRIRIEKRTEILIVNDWLLTKEDSSNVRSFN